MTDMTLYKNFFAIWFKQFTDADAERKTCLKILKDNLHQLIHEKCEALGQDDSDAVLDMFRILDEGNPEAIKKQIDYWIALDPNDAEENENLLKKF